jgi:hypothetical protein
LVFDSDDSLDVMEAEETDDVTDDDTPVARKKGASAPKRIRRKLRTRKSRVRRGATIVGFRVAGLITCSWVGVRML